MIEVKGDRLYCVPDRSDRRVHELEGLAKGRCPRINQAMGGRSKQDQWQEAAKEAEESQASPLGQRRHSDGCWEIGTVAELRKCVRRNGQ